MRTLFLVLAVGLLLLGSGSAYAAQPPLLVDVEVIGEGTVTSTPAGID